MYEHSMLVDGVYLEARIAEQWAGCGVLFEDNQTQLTTALGLAKDITCHLFSTPVCQFANSHHAPGKRLAGACQVKKQLVSNWNFITLCSQRDIPRFSTHS